MDPDPLRLLETAPPLRSSTLSANPANSRFSVREDRSLASSEAVNKIPQKTLTDQLRSLVLEKGARTFCVERSRNGRQVPIVCCPDEGTMMVARCNLLPGMCPKKRPVP